MFVMAAMIGAYLTAFLASLVVWAVSGQGQGQSFGEGNVNNFLSDRNLVMRQIKCVQGLGACDNVGNMLKLAIPEVLKRNCRSCSAQQASNARKLINYVQTYYPEDWSKIQARYVG